MWVIFSSRWILQFFGQQAKKRQNSLQLAKSPPLPFPQTIDIKQFPKGGMVLACYERSAMQPALPIGGNQKMGKLKSVAVGLYLGIAAIGLTSISAQAGPLPVLIDFTVGTAGMFPPLCGANRPTALFNPARTTVLVQSSANGLAHNRSKLPFLPPVRSPAGDIILTHPSAVKSCESNRRFR